MTKLITKLTKRGTFKYEVLFSYISETDIALKIETAGLTEINLITHISIGETGINLKGYKINLLGLIHDQIRFDQINYLFACALKNNHFNTWYTKRFKTF